MKQQSRGNTFWTVQYLHKGMCYDEKYHKVSFSQRDKVIAKLLNKSINYICSARYCFGFFKKFESKKDKYLSSHLKKKDLFEIVQTYYVNLRSEEQYKDVSPAVLDAIIAKDLGYGFSYIKAARCGSAQFRKFRGCVDDRCFEYRLGNSKKTAEKVKRTYLRLLNTKKFANLSKNERDQIVANKLNFKKNTVRAVRLGHSIYKKHGTLYNSK